MFRRLIFSAISVLILGIATLVQAQQEPLDLFPDVPALGDDFIRVGAWNLRHINLEGDADDLLPGNNEEKDFEILTATFAKAIQDLGLDIVAISEHQPRSAQPNRLHQIRDHLNAGPENPWQANESQIPYDNPNSPFSGLQLAVLWNSQRVTVDTTNIQLLSQLRQPRDQAGVLLNQNMRAPWMVPVTAGQLSFDLIVVHLKSGGASPQAAEVTALSDFLRTRLTQADPRHVVLVGDWNIRPDTSSGRSRLSQLQVPNSGQNLMRVLTIESLPLDLNEWSRMSSSQNDRDSFADVTPATHFNATTRDTFLDHIAISSTLDEIFDHPIEVTLATGNTDIRPGIRIARPLMPEQDFHELTDHMPVVLTLRTNLAGAPGGSGAIVGPLRIVSARPNPIGDDTQNEQVTLRNISNTDVNLTGWGIGDSTGQVWLLNSSDGTVIAGQSFSVVRNGRAMALNNNGGDQIVLIKPDGEEIHRVAYSGSISSGALVTF